MLNDIHVHLRGISVLKKKYAFVSVMASVRIADAAKLIKFDEIFFQQQKNL